MTVDFHQRKSAKRTSKRASQKTEDGKRIRGGKTVPRKQRGMCAKDPPLPPKLREEDELRAARERNERKKAEKLKRAARAMREKMAAKGVPGAAKPLSKMRGPRSRGDEDRVSDDDDVNDDDDGANAAAASSAPDAELDASSVPDYFEDALRSLGHKRTTPIQRECWPPCCAGRDVLGIAPPGSGKTLAYLLPAVEFAMRDARDRPRPASAPRGRPSAAILAPTRELAAQVAGVCGKLRRAAPVRCVAVYGGTNQEEQEEELGRSSSMALVVVGTPGRVLATMETGALGLERARMFVLDEADRMLALGFADQLEAIRAALPRNERDDADGGAKAGSGSEAAAGPGMGAREGRQTLLFSATFPKTVRAVAKLWLAPNPAIVKIEAEDKSSNEGRRSNAANVSVAAGGKTKDGGGVSASDVEQTVHVCAEHKKARKLLKHVTDLRENDGRSKSRVLVFANRIKTVRFVAETLRRHGEKVGSLHGELKQEKREAALRDFKSGKTPCLVATDVAGRGLDITGLEHVVNWDMPGSVEQYAHRVGRAGRSGRRGAALSFFTRNMAPLAPDLVKMLKRGGHFVDPNLEVLAKVGEALNKSERGGAGEGGRGGEADGDDEEDASDDDRGGESEETEEEESGESDEEEESGESDEEESGEEESDEEESGEESDDDEGSSGEESEGGERADDASSDGDPSSDPAADPAEVLDRLVAHFREENGRDPKAKEMLRLIKTLRDAARASGGAVSLETRADDDSDDSDGASDSDSAKAKAKAKAEAANAPASKKRAAATDAAREDAAPAKKTKSREDTESPAKSPAKSAAKSAAKSPAKSPPAAAAAFLPAKAFAGAKPGYYFRKGAKGLGYYVDRAATPHRKRPSVFDAPKSAAREAFVPAKKFAGAKAGYAFKKGARGLGYYLDAPPKPTWRPPATKRGNLGGGFGGKKGGRGGRRR